MVSVEYNLPFIHTWKLERLLLSGKLWDYSRVFPGGGYRWKLALNLDHVHDGKSYLSLFLALLDTASLPLHIEVVLESNFLNERNCYCSKKSKVTHRCGQSKSEGCHPYLVSLETLKCPSSGILVVEIIDIIIHPEENVCLSPKPQNTNSVAYTWKIDGFSKLASLFYYTSGPFVYNNHIWFLELYPRGYFTDGKSISLYLKLDVANPLSSSVKIRAKYFIDWEDQIKGNDHRRRNVSTFDCKSPIFGWGNFISLDALHEPSNGFLVNDTCIIKLSFLKFDVSTK